MQHSSSKAKGGASACMPFIWPCSVLSINVLTFAITCVQVYHLMQHILFKQTSLLYNRHLDQVLLSAVYGVCKVAQLKQISFKQIINHYRRQPQAKSDIFRTVVLKQTEVELQVPCCSFLQHLGKPHYAATSTWHHLYMLMCARVCVCVCKREGHTYIYCVCVCVCVYVCEKQRGTHVHTNTPPPPPPTVLCMLSCPHQHQTACALLRLLFCLS